jgi:DNA-binding transcriptional MerR regulator
MTMLDPTVIELPQIPGKRYFTIGEVSELCIVKPHVLRYWEQEFPQLRPVKRRGNRRYYQRHEVELIREIRRLLYLEGYTINGARNRIQQQTGRRGSRSEALEFDQCQHIIDELEQISALLDD